MNTSRFAAGFGWGLVATIVMTVVMVIGRATGAAPIPEPIPAALVKKIFGDGLSAAAVMPVAVACHLLYGAVWGGIAAAAMRPITIGKGLGLGTFLWLLMQVIVLPSLGWGAFGTLITPAIAVATLVLHLVYGGTYGWLMDRR